MYDISFFEEYKDKNNKENVKKRLTMFAFIVGILIVSFILIMNIINIRGINREISELDQIIEDPNTKSKVLEIQEKRTLAKSMETELGTLERFNLFIQKNDVVNDKLLGNIFNRVNEGVYLSEVSVRDHSIHIVGVTDSKESISKFEHNLIEVDEFEYVFVENITTDKDRRFYDFSLQVQTAKVEIEEIDDIKDQPKEESEEESEEEEVDTDGD